MQGNGHTIPFPSHSKAPSIGPAPGWFGSPGAVLGVELSRSCIAVKRSTESELVLP